MSQLFHSAALAFVPELTFAISAQELPASLKALSRCSSAGVQGVLVRLLLAGGAAAAGASSVLAGAAGAAGWAGAGAGAAAWGSCCCGTAG